MYITAANLKTYLGVSGSGDDVLLGILITNAQSMIDNYVNRTFEAAADTTKYLDSTRDVSGNVLYLEAAGDLCAITSITNGDGTAIASTKYVLEPRNGTPYYAIRLLDSSSLAWEPQSDGDTENAITIVGRWAYSTSAPADIAQAATRLAAYLYRQKDNALDIDRTILAGNATILPANLPSDLAQILKPYRRLV